MATTLARAATLPRRERTQPQSYARTRPRRLLHVMPSFAVGGIQMRLARLINAFGPRFHHTILAIDGRKSCRDNIEREIGVSFAATPGKGGLLGRLAADRAAIARAEPDLLLTYNWGAIEWAMANRAFGICPHVHFEDGFGPEEATRQLRRRALLRRLALKRAMAVVVPSRTLENIAIARWRLPPEQLRYVPNGIDVDAFDAEASGPPLFARSRNEIIIGTVTPLRPEKNLGRLIGAFARIEIKHSLRLVIAGDGPERLSLEDLVRRKGLAGRVLFLGAVREPERALALYDIFALSSDTEQMPMTVLEAMAAELPIAASDIGDIRLMVSPANRGFITAQNDEAALAVSIGALADDARRRKELGRLNRAYVSDTFPFSRMADAYARIFGGKP
jgi:glycosyltransferase involved in cell wall biosynthesis